MQAKNTPPQSKVNIQGREFTPGKPLSSDIRDIIIKTLLEFGANNLTCHIPRGGITKASVSFKVSKSTIKNIWIKYCEDGENLPRAKKGAGGGNPRKLKDADLNLVESLIKDKPSTSYNVILDNIEQYSATGRVSKPTLSRAVTGFLSDKYSFKLITRQMKNKYTDENINYYQHFIDFINQVDIHKLKFFDESGFNKSVANPTRGHSLVNERCIEIGGLHSYENMTLNLMVSIDGINYINFVDGASNTDTYVNFFEEAANSHSSNGLPSLSPEDIVIVDNCLTHRFEGEIRTSTFLDSIGVGYIFLPRYSPELNIAENCFGKIKAILKQERYRNIVEQNIKVAVSRATEEITVSDLKGFCVATRYLNVQI